MKLLLAFIALAALPLLQGCAAQQPGQSTSFSGGMLRKSAMRQPAEPARTATPARAYGARAQEIADDDAAVEAALQRGAAPAVPEDAKDLMAKGKAYVAQARSAGDYSAAVAAMKQALALAPGWASGYYNLALAEEGAGLWSDARRHLKYYTKLAPAASDKEAVRMKIAELSVREERGD